MSDDDPTKGMTEDSASLSVRDLAERLARGHTFAVLDVREPNERAYCAIAVPPPCVDMHVPMGAVPERLGEIREVAAGLPLVVYCHHGVRSGMVAEWLRRQGVRHVFNLEGGIDDWSRSVDPAVRRY